MENLQGYKIPFDKNLHNVEIVQGRNGPWSHRKFNRRFDLSNALDFALPFGSEVRAARSGIVIWTHDLSEVAYRGLDTEVGINLPYGTANFLWVRHQDETIAIYAHLAKSGIVVQNHQLVSRGEVIAHTGESGWVGPIPHLHFQVSSGPPYRSIPIRFEDYDGPLEHLSLGQVNLHL